MAELAIHGGPPVWSGSWPPWPQAGSGTLASLDAVLASGRWAISGPWSGEETRDQRFCRRFADYLGCRHALLVDHGSSALVAALLALGVEPGQEVIVPGLTWVACATAVLRVNAIPVLVDVEPETLCLSPDAVAAAITPRSAAVLAVHLYSAMAAMDRLRELSEHHGLALIEDAAQAHGAEWGGRRAGSLGDVGTFSFQQGKVLTCGEGGAIVTSDADLAARLERLRSDGRHYRPDAPPPGHPHLVESSLLQGFNFCLSELQAAVLLDGFERLEEQTERRAAAADRLTSLLAAVEGLEPIRPHAANNRRAYYHYAVRFHPEAFAGCSAAVLCRALAAELGLWVHATYPPLDVHPLYQPERYPALAPQLRSRLQPRPRLPEAHRQHARTLLFHHPALLAEPAAIEAVAEAFAKIRRHRGELERIAEGA